MKQAQPIVINSIFGGISATEYFGQQGEFLGSIGIDPDMPKSDSSIRMSGLIRPTAMAKFSGTTITDVPYWIVTNPKNSNVNIYAKDGKIHNMDSTLAFTGDVGTVTTSSGNGCAYYDNALYFASNTDIARYYPMNGSPSLNQSYYVGTLALTALTNTTYPSINGIPIPNHAMTVHLDDALYICDVNSSNQGIINKIATKKTTVEGDTNNSSLYNALDFSYNEYPTCVATYFSELAIGCIVNTSSTIRQAPAKLFFWDCKLESFSKEVVMPDPLITAMKWMNGYLYVFSGNANGGCRVTKFTGGYTFEEIGYYEDVFPPLQGAVDGFFNKIIFGSHSEYPTTSVSVFSIGSKNSKIPMGLHNILKSTSAGAHGMVTAVKYVTQSDFSDYQPIICWKDDTTQGADRQSTVYSSNVWRSEVFKIGAPFRIDKLRIPLAQAVGANMTIVPKIYFDDETSSRTLTTINNTNFNGKKNIIYKFDGTHNINGEHNFYLELTWSGSALCTVNVPISFSWTSLDD